MGWREVGTGQGGGAGILKWNTGERKMLHILFRPKEEPHNFRQHYFKSLNKGATCIGAGCPACALPNNKAALRHVFRVYDYKEKRVAHWIASDTTATSIKNTMEAAKEAGQTLDTLDLAVTRQGDKQQTRYDVSSFPSRFKDSMAPDAEWPELTAPVKETTLEELEMLCAGQDPSTEFNPEELEHGAQPAKQVRALEKPVQNDPWMGATGSDEVQDASAETSATWDDTPAAEPEPAPEPAPAKPAAIDRNTLLRQALQKYSTSPKLKAPGAKDKFLQHFAPGKKTLSQATMVQLQEMIKALS